MSKGLATPIIVKPALSYTMLEAAEATGIGRSTLYEEVAAGRLVVKKRGRSTVILTEELHRFLQSLPNLDPEAARTEALKASEN